VAQLMPLPLTVSCFSKIDQFYLSGTGSPGVVLDKGPLNGCVCVCVCVWHQLDNMQTVCSRHITTSTPQHSIFTGWMLIQMPNQQCQSTEGIEMTWNINDIRN